MDVFDNPSAGSMRDIPSNPAANPSPDPQFVTAPVEIAGILKRMHDMRALLHVSFPGGNEIWLSAVIEVRTAQNEFHIDELAPQDGNALLLRERRMVITAQMQGVDVRFAANLTGTGTSDGLVYYRFALPEGIRYWQRRASYRARVSAATVIPVVLRRNDDREFNGELLDISRGGIGMRIKSGKQVAPQPGERWEECRITPAGHPPIVTPVEIRFIAQDVRPGCFRMGLQFVDIPRPQLKHVENLVSHLEREALRKLRRTRTE